VLADKLDAAPIAWLFLLPVFVLGHTWDEDELLQRTSEFYRALQEHGVTPG
jgi:hypothetical protein